MRWLKLLKEEKFGPTISNQIYRIFAHMRKYARYTVLSEKAKPLLKSSSCPDALLRPTLNNQVYQKAQGPMLTQIFCFG